MVDPKVVSIVKNYLTAVTGQGLQVSRAFIYGSQVRGTAGPESDIDLLIVSPSFDQEIDKYLGILWEGEFRCQHKIEPYPVGEMRFQNDDSSPLIAVVKEEGVEVEV